MHNTSIEYKQMHNKTISWNDNWILIFICFLGRLLLSTSSYSSFITTSFLIQMDKRFFKNWVLRIPHRLRDLLWIVRAWYSFSPIFSSLIISRDFSSSQSLLKVINSFWHTFLEWMNPMILGGHYHNFCILHFFFYPFTFFFDLRDPCKVWLYGLWFLDLSHSSSVFSKSSFGLRSFLQISWSRIQRSL